jgi:cytochrome c oxidase subunit 2
MPVQSVLHPASEGAQVMSTVAWVLFIGGALIFLAVMTLVVRAVLSAPRQIDGRRWIIGGGLVLPVVVLSALLIYGLGVGAALSHGHAENALRVHVIGKRWWWEVRYESPGGEWIVLANELHLPVNRPVTLALTTDDVIHSFWVPALAGKIDMIPGRTNQLFVQANREGVYRGQCAEYCGSQHALMAFDIVVEAPEAFDEWLKGQQQPAREPQSASTQRGREAFFRAGCNTCHTIRGTPARGQLGPDLTHVGSRRTLGAGTLPNHPGAMAGWIAGTQAIKPASLMPSMNVLPGAELRDLSAYLSELD